MSIQAHKCNQEGCNGFILFDNADFNYKKSINNNEYVLDKPKCNKCGKEFQVVISHTLIEYDEEKCELLDEVPQCCYTEYENSKSICGHCKRVGSESMCFVADEPCWGTIVDMRKCEIIQKQLEG